MDIDGYVLSPSDHFDSPGEVLSDERLSTEQRVRVLESWRLDVQRLQASQSEGFEGEDHAQLLQQLDQALHALADPR